MGTFYVWAQVPQASPFGPYGVFALGLSGFSPVLKDWPGGGRMAIHGTSDPADQGQMVSHGCVRVYNPDMTLLKHVPMGTPVVIHG
jgi:lipoprotein-anchoring transpeptidase ErfK/SrfK